MKPLISVYTLSRKGDACSRGDSSAKSTRHWILKPFKRYAAASETKRCQFMSTYWHSFYSGLQRYQDQLLSLTPPSPVAIGTLLQPLVISDKNLETFGLHAILYLPHELVLLSLTSELNPVTLQSALCCVSVDVCSVTGIYSVHLYVPMIRESVYERQNIVSPNVDNS
jgi:hypothetical protein